MKAEIIAVGTELLLGQVTNTNATFLSEQLADLGIEVYYHTVVGDNRQRLEELLTLAESRSELIVLCGGLGPTEDDLTKEAVAAHLGNH
jgi:nicotinamide-nucleotide amidase